MKLIKLFKENYKLPEMLGANSAAEESRNCLSLALVSIKKVATAQEQETTVAAMRDAHTYVKDVERVGLEFRRPAQQFVALCKATEDDHLAPLKAELARVKPLLTAFQDAEDRRVREEEQARQAAIQAKENERLRLEKEAADAAQRAAESGSKKDLKAAEKLADKAEQAEQATRELILAPEPEAAKAAGQSLKQVVRYEVTDADALYKARPELFTKPELKKSAVNAVCFPNSAAATKQNPDKTSVPGMALWYERDSGVRRW